MNQKSILYVALFGLVAFFAYKFLAGGVKKTGYSVSTPFGGGSLTENPLNDTINVSATLKKKGKKKGGWLKKALPKIAQVAAGFIPGAGGAISAGIGALSKPQ